MLPSDEIFCSFSARLVLFCGTAEYKAVIIWLLKCKAQLQMLEVSDGPQKSKTTTTISHYCCYAIYF